MFSPFASQAARGANSFLTDAIRDGLASLDKAPDSVTVDDLAPVDELHIGGRKASEDFSTNSGSVRISMFSMLDAALADLRDLSRSMGNDRRLKRRGGGRSVQESP